MAGGDLADGVQVGRPAVEMDRDNGFRPSADGFFYFLRIYIPSFWINIGEFNGGAAMENYVGGRNKGQRSGDNFVSGSNS